MKFIISGFLKSNIIVEGIYVSCKGDSHPGIYQYYKEIDFFKTMIPIS